MTHHSTTQQTALHVHPADGPRKATALLRILLAAAVTALVLAGCGGAADDRRVGTSARETVSAEAVTPAPSARPRSNPSSTVARARGELRVYDRPGDGRPATVLAATTGFGSPTVVLVSTVGTGARDGWLKVLLPVRPNGATGWIRTSDVDLRTVALQVRIDLARRQLTVFDGEARLLTTATAIGEPDNPTPTGRFFVIDKLETPDPSGAYGPYAIGLSAHSEVLTEFAGGDGQIGMHGTNAPDSIGRPVSHGCLRVNNAFIERLAHLLPLGTPVTIV